MLRFLFLMLALAFIHFSCTENAGTTSVESIRRDTSITPQNAYTNLVLDSVSVEQFLQEQGEEIVVPKIRNFYNSRNYQFAWFDEEGLTEHGEAFWNIYQMRLNKLNDSLLYNQELEQHMEGLLNEDSLSLSHIELKNIELDLTRNFFKYLHHAFNGKVPAEEMQWHIPTRKIDEQAMLDSFLTGNQNSWKPLNPSFYTLRNKIVQYSSIAKKGGWPRIDITGKELRKGMVDTVIAQLKKRIILTGVWESDDISPVYDDSLFAAVKRLQRSYGLRVTGIANDDLIKELNVPAVDRIKQMKINLERMRWMPEENEHRLLANIPEYKLHVYEKGNEVISMDIVVGKAANRTVIFSDEMEYIVFSPFWNVPRSIVRNEILPSINNSSGYLRRHNMEITGHANGLPVVRQKPGSGNALGKVKFIFPNRYNIYFHDTPAKSLFKREKRAFSHGCIRLHKPFELVKYLLRKEDKWTDNNIKSAMNKESEKWVKLNEPVSVLIVYFTSWVDNAGLLHFRKDIYGHDKRMEEHLFN